MSAPLPGPAGRLTARGPLDERRPRCVCVSRRSTEEAAGSGQEPAADPKPDTAREATETMRDDNRGMTRRAWHAQSGRLLARSSRSRPRTW